MPTLSSLPTVFFPQWFQPSRSKAEIPVISMLGSPAQLKGLPGASINFRNVKNLSILYDMLLFSAADIAIENGHGKDVSRLLFSPIEDIQIPSPRPGKVKNPPEKQRRLHILSASNSSPSEQDAVTEKGDGGAQSPPFLTILAGAVVFVFICWVVGSMVMWLIGLILPS